MKPREFWIFRHPEERSRDIVYSSEPKQLKPNQIIHCREVVAIDWNKLWADYLKQSPYTSVIAMNALAVQRLVERQLAGEE